MPPGLRELFRRRCDALVRCPLPEESFRKLSVTHIAIFNPRMVQGFDCLSVLMELPVGGNPHWTRVDAEAAKSLVGRYMRVLESNRTYRGNE